jgi:hypothetical protein
MIIITTNPHKIPIVLHGKINSGKIKMVVVSKRVYNLLKRMINDRVIRSTNKR